MHANQSYKRQLVSVGVLAVLVFLAISGFTLLFFQSIITV